VSRSVAALLNQLGVIIMAQANFDFKSYNETMKSANSGLRLFLALQSLQEVEQVMRRFRSPFANDIVDIVDLLVTLRDNNKAYLAKRENTTSGDLDNSTLPDGSMTQASNSADAGKVTA
jgi:hypothetical protein